MRWEKSTESPSASADSSDARSSPPGALRAKARQPRRKGAPLPYRAIHFDSPVAGPGPRPQGRGQRQSSASGEPSDRFPQGVEARGEEGVFRNRRIGPKLPKRFHAPRHSDPRRMRLAPHPWRLPPPFPPPEPRRRRGREHRRSRAQRRAGEVPRSPARDGPNPQQRQSLMGPVKAMMEMRPPLARGPPALAQTLRRSSAPGGASPAHPQVAE